MRLLQVIIFLLIVSSNVLAGTNYFNEGLAFYKNNDFDPILIDAVGEWVQKKSKTNVEQIIISKNETVSVKEFGYKLKFKKVFKTEGNHAKSIFVDMDKLKFPLKLRNWISGDSFYPKGMKGKKKISKFLKDEKLSH